MSDAIDLAVSDALAALDRLCGERAAPVRRHAPCASTLAQAFEEHCVGNTPAVFEAATRTWPCASRWCKHDGSLDWAALASDFHGQQAVVAAASTPHTPGAYASTLRHEAIETYVARVTSSDCTDYLKDWHMQLANVTRCDDMYRVPALFADDYLNFLHNMLAAAAEHPAPQHGESGAQPSACVDAAEPRSANDYRFLYCGPAGSSTLLHTDVMHSCSWSVNVAGCKLWLFLSPHASEALYNVWRDLTVEDVRTAEEVSATHRVVQLVRAAVGRTPLPPEPAPLSRAPSAAPSLPTSTARVDGLYYTIQRAGEAVFVPPAWHHQVHNLDDTLSINHNWFNGASVRAVGAFLRHELARVRESIADCRSAASSGAYDAEWESTVQRLLKSNAALSVDEFVCALLAKASHYCSNLRSGACDTTDEGSAAGGSAAGGSAAGGSAAEEGDMWRRTHVPSTCDAMAGCSVMSAPHLTMPRGITEYSLQAIGDELRAWMGDAYVQHRQGGLMGMPADTTHPPPATAAQVAAVLHAWRGTPALPQPPTHWTLADVQAALERITAALARGA